MVVVNRHVVIVATTLPTAVVVCPQRPSLLLGLRVVRKEIADDEARTATVSEGFAKLGRA
jgi:hypothetical protein